MSSVTEIETAIQKLSLAEQRIIALHLDARLVDQEHSGGFPSAEEGIRFLPQFESCQPVREARRKKLRQRAEVARRRAARKASANGR